MKENVSLRKLEAQCHCIYADLYQTCGTLPLHSFEHLCSRLHAIQVRMHSFRGGLNTASQ